MAKRSGDHVVCDAQRKSIRCLICGDEVPMPLGSIPWVTAVMRPFGKEHPSIEHKGLRTWFGHIRTGKA